MKERIIFLIVLIVLICFYVLFVSHELNILATHNKFLNYSSCFAYYFISCKLISNMLFLFQSFRYFNKLLISDVKNDVDFIKNNCSNFYCIIN